MRSAAATRTPSSSTWYCVSEARLRCWVSVTPGARGIDQEEVDVASGASPVRASTTRRVAALAKGTWRFVPREHEAVAVAASRASCTPSGPKPPLRLEPGRREDRLARGDARQPASASAPRCPPRAARPRRSRRSRSAATAPARGRAPRRRSPPRAAPGPTPPYSSGISRPMRPSSAELLPELRGVAHRVVLHRAHDLERRVLRAHAAHHLAQHLLLFAEVEIHAALLRRATASSRRRGASRDCRLARRGARCARCTRCRCGRRR